MPHRLYPEVAERADYRCEYCKSPEAISPGLFEVEHIEPHALGGSDDLRNLALACPPCNRRKARATEAIDPESETIHSVPLYNPRLHVWDDNFAFDITDERILIVGLTPTGRATVQRLGMNDLHIVDARLLWSRLELFPP
jgi:hypothetical protein